MAAVGNLLHLSEAVINLHLFLPKLLVTDSCIIGCFTDVSSNLSGVVFEEAFIVFLKHESDTWYLNILID